MESDMVMELSKTPMALHTKGIGLTTKNGEKEKLHMRMETVMREALKMIFIMDTVWKLSIRSIILASIWMDS